ncbi:MAG: hypothetical protein U5M51_09735 [Emticicia sp.]|nr:hypothetical protein [Emticicia sp.]
MLSLWAKPSEMKINEIIVSGKNLELLNKRRSNIHFKIEEDPQLIVCRNARGFNYIIGSGR